MSDPNPFDKFDAAPATAPPAPSSANTFDQFDARPAYSGGILPFSQDAAGNTSFDINAGIPGALIRAFTAPGEVYSGKLDPTSPEGNQRAAEMAGMFSPMNPATRAGMGGVAAGMRRPAMTPTTGELKTAASAGYDATRATGAEYPGDAISNLAATTQTGLQSDGILPILAPQTHAVLGQLQNAPGGSVVSIASLDAARKAFSNIRANNVVSNRTDAAAAGRAIDAIDEYISTGGRGTNNAAASGDLQNLPSIDPVDPAQATAARLLTEARGNAAAGFRSDRINGVEDAADLRSAAANSGQNLGNTLRQRLATLLLNPKQTAGFSPEELAALRQVVEGTTTSNTLRRVGNMLGGGGGIGQTVVAGIGGSIGHALGGGVGAGVGASAAAALGTGARSAYNDLVARQVRQLDDLLRQRSPLYQGRTGLLSASPWDSRALAAVRGGLLGPMDIEQNDPSGLLSR